MNFGKLFRLENSKFLWVMVLGAICVGIVRQLWWHYFSSLRPPLGPMWIFAILFPFVITIFIVFIILSVLSVWTILRTNSIVQLLVLIVGVIIAFFVKAYGHGRSPNKKECRAGHSSSIGFSYKLRTTALSQNVFRACR